MFDIPSQFGCNVFSDKVMRERLSPEVYARLQSTIAANKHIELDIANIVASAMKEWAVEKGCTHFSHWFQPMTGVTAEKHDGFIAVAKDGTAIMEFSGKELVKGEPDASSFPNGGIRATFEARGYTAWDATSFAFIKDNTLYIPTAFFSYGGDALDKKTPLLRSMQIIEEQVRRILNLFGKKPNKINTTVGAEQEYFLIDSGVYKQRLDLVLCGRTLFGAKPPKGQELEDHYYGAIKPRVMAYMQELDEELWKMGIFSKTKHNEVAPAQHELAPIYTSVNLATDHNQLTMEIMKKVAQKRGLACLLHEKPFLGVNGSGKHNNWSINADSDNLFEPGDTPAENAQFLLFLTAMLKAVDEHQDLLRIAVASAGNDHRLGASEAPPAIISLFLGEELDELIDCIITDKSAKNRTKTYLEIGANILPYLRKDNTDRNRTSPIAFTGNKFECRMPGSSCSIADINIILNTIYAAALDSFATELEDAKDFDNALSTLVKRELNAHRRIVYSGNNYSDEWKREAEKRGLLNLRTTVDAIPYLIHPRNIELFTKYGIFSEREIHARYEVLLDAYSKVVNIEALTMLDLVRHEVLPASFAYVGALSENVLRLKQIGDGSKTSSFAEESVLRELTILNDIIYRQLKTLELAEVDCKLYTDALTLAKHCRDDVLRLTTVLREYVDKVEQLVGKRYWKLPNYADILYSV